MGQHARIGHKGHERVVAAASTFAKVVAPRAALLLSIAAQHCGVQIQREGLQPDSLEQVLIQAGEGLCDAGMVKLVQQPRQSPVVGDACIAKDGAQDAIQAGDFQMLEAVGPAPNFKHELSDQLFGGVATVAAGLGQLSALECSVPADMAEHGEFGSCAATMFDSSGLGIRSS
jgi:hypothetical protein